MGAFQPWHLIVLAVVVVALFGYNKLPDVTRSVGRSLRIFKTEMKGLSEDDKVREEAKELGLPTAAPAVTPVPVAPPVTTETTAAPASAATPSADEIARAEAVLAAAAKARSDAAASNGAGPAPEHAAH